jgi:hypothetical protein
VAGCDSRFDEPIRRAVVLATVREYRQAIARFGAMASFAESFADQNERDYRALQKAAASGRIDIETGP